MKSEKNIISGPPFKQKWTYKSTADFLMDRIQKHGSSPALISIETGEMLTYNQVIEKSLKLSISLKKLGFKLNDRIGICSENNLNYGLAFLSNIFLGTTICPLNPSYTEREFIHTLKISKPKYIFVSLFTLEKIRKIIKDLPWISKLILLYPEASNLDIPNVPDLISKTSDSELKKFKLPEINLNDHVLLIACSSGTTGFPKGVMLTDKNILVQMQSYEEEPIPFMINAESFLGFLPFFHLYGCFIFILSLTFKAKLIIMSKFEERLFLKAVEKYRIKTLALVPSIMVFLAKSSLVDDYDLSSVKQILCGAAPLPKKIRETVKKRFKFPVFRNGYGMTESTVSIMSSREGQNVDSVGVLRSGLTAKVIPLEGNSKETLGPNCEGELCFKGDIVMKGYCGDEKATKATIDEDGFLHTGDVGYYDEDGYFYIVDRVKELIKYKGFQVPPAELESILLSYPAIKDAAVVGLPDELAGELPLAFIVKEPGIEVTAEEIINYVNDRVSSQKRLRGGVRFIEGIPKNPSGKILRRQLRSILKSNL